MRFHFHSMSFRYHIGSFRFNILAFLLRSVVLLFAICPLPLLIAASPRMPSDDGQASPVGIAFFEENIRPLLENRCYKCHSAQATELHANLYLDSRPGWQKGGDSGPAIVVGKPSESLIVKAIRYSKDAATRMPPEGKLPDKEIDLLNKWIEIVHGEVTFKGFEMITKLEWRWRDKGCLFDRRSIKSQKVLIRSKLAGTLVFTSHTIHQKRMHLLDEKESYRLSPK